MKTIGILGGMSWESSALYYRLLNEGARARRGGLHSAPCLLYSMDFEPLQRLQHDNRWDDIARRLSAAARRLQEAGAELLLLATNTMHKIAPAIQAAIDIPLLHIADAVGEECARRGLGAIGLLATAFTMEQDFYKTYLRRRHAVEVMLPPPPMREELHRIIYQELCRGVIRPESKRFYLSCIDDLAAAGAQAALLGCTEIGLLISAQDSKTLLLDSAALHAEYALRQALA